MSRSRPRSRSLLVVALFAAISTVLATLAVPAFAADGEATATGLTVAPESPVYGEDSITLTAVVTGYETEEPVAGGTVTFSAMLNPAAGGQPSSQPVDLGSAEVDEDGVAVTERPVDSVAISGLQEGQTFYVTASYQPASDAYQSSTSTPFLVQPVAAPDQPMPTTTTVTGPTTATVGVPVNLTAIVSPSEAAGLVQFYVDDAPVGAPSPIGDGLASREYTFDETGEVEVAAVFEPFDQQSYASSDGSAMVLVSLPDPELTTTTLTGPSSATVGMPVDLTASVSPSEAAGTVRFYVDEEVVGETEVVDGTATVEYAFEDDGETEVYAVFTPTDSNSYALSSDSEIVVVSPAEGDPQETSTTVTGPGSATVGVPVDLTATVSPSDAAGTVQFSVDDEPVGQPVPVVDGVATRSHTFGSTGGASVTAAFTPSDPEEYVASDDLIGTVVAVSPPFVPPSTPTTTSVAAPASAKVGRPITLTATVSPANDGTVQFYVDDAPVGAPAPVLVGMATLSHTFTTAASVRVSAVFTPIASNVAGSRAPDVTVQVTRTEPSVQVTGPDTATVGQEATLTVAVLPADAAGTVQFSVDGSPVGSPVPVAAGAASVSHTFTTAGAATVRATFEPTDDDTYGSSTSPDHVVDVQRVATTVDVTGPDDTQVGDEVRLRASVLPADASGKVTFFVNGDSVATVDVESGTASTPYTFESEGSVSLGASFAPTDDGTYRSSTSAARTLDVEPGATSESEEQPVTTQEVTTEFDYCAGRAVSGRVGPFDTFFSGIILNVSTFIYDGLSFIANTFSQIANFIGLTFQVGPFAGGPCGKSGGRHRDIEPMSGTVQCVLTDVGYACPIDLPAGARLTVTAAVPIPADLAGRRVKIVSTLSAADPETGELTKLGSGTTKFGVPKRTVLSAKLAPVKSNLASVQRGKAVTYRVRVGNEGVFAADGVRTCIQVGPGAKIRTARGATVRGQRVCWTLPSLKKGQSVIRKLTVVAPRTRHDLTLRAIVTPKKKQADVVRLTTALPVR